MRGGWGWRIQGSSSKSDCTIQQLCGLQSLLLWVNLKTNFSVLGRIREDTVRRCSESRQEQLLLLNTLPEDGVHLPGFASSIHLTGRASAHTVNILFLIQEAHSGKPLENLNYSILVHGSQGKYREFLDLISGLPNSQPCQLIYLEQEPLGLSPGLQDA